MERRKGTPGQSARSVYVSHKSDSAQTRATRGSRAMEEPESDKQELLERFFIEELKDIYWAEKYLSKVLGKMAKEATSSELQQIFEDHQEETQEQVSRLEEIFDILDKRPQAKKCIAIEGIYNEVERVIEETPDDSFTRDVALIIGGQKIEHYEIAAYGGLAQLASTLGHDDIADLLHDSLDDEKDADEKLSELAESHINEDALAE